MNDTMLLNTLGILFPIVINYPTEVKSAQAKKAYKHKILRGTPKALTVDFCRTGERLVITDLLLYTDSIDAWHKTICALYDHHKKRAYAVGGTQPSKMRDSPPFTVNVYHSVTSCFKAMRLVSALSRRTLMLSKPLQKQRQDKDRSEERSSANYTDQPSREGCEEKQPQETVERTAVIQRAECLR